MALKELSAKELGILLRPNPVPKQTSKFLIWYDVTMRCASRGCGSATWCKFKGVPYCMKHVIDKMDELLNEMHTKLYGGEV